MEKISFDDVAALQKRVGEEFGEWSGELEISQKMIDQFAELTGDRQWIHVDVERAERESPFGTTIAHGFLTLSILPSLRGQSGKEPEYAITGYRNAVNYGSDKLRFVSPVPANSKIHSRSRLAAVEATAKGTRVTREIAVHVVGQERPALLYSMIVLYQG